MSFSPSWIRSKINFSRFNHRSLPAIIILIVVSGFVSYCCLSPSGLDSTPPDTVHSVRILLGKADPGESLRFSVDGPYKVFRGSVPRPYDAPGWIFSGYRLKDGEVQVDDNREFQLNGRSLPGQAFVVVPETEGTLGANGKRYNGVFLVQIKERRALWLLNDLDIESYLAGVLFMEMPRNFNEEALKAQVVAARTYALHRSTTGAQYLTDDTRSQVYGGADAVSPRSETLVAATRGEVLTYKGKLFAGLFSSTCGGISARANDAFSGTAPAPLNENVPCPYCNESPHAQWRVSFSLREVRERFDLPAGQETINIGITAFDPARRALEITFLDGRGGILKRCSAASFRSTLNRGKPHKEQVLSTRIEGITFKQGVFQISGRGWGHGVGLCQYGADGLADKGRNYQDILEHYYPGADLVERDTLQ